MTSEANASTTAHDAQRARAQTFRQLHEGMLVLPNAWDAASASVVEDAGAAAVTTTSAGVAWSLGAADGGQLGRDRAIGMIARVVAAVDVPVTADIEDGYGTTLDDLAATITAVLAAGAVGVNVEDTVNGAMIDIAEQVDRIGAVRAAADAAGISLFINARTDLYLRGVGEPGERLAATAERAEAYLAAGADGIFVPGLHDLATIAELVSAIPAPLNIMAGSGAPSVPELGDLGVRRVSAGSAIAQAAYGLAHRAAVEMLTAGTYESSVDGFDYGRLNSLLTARGA